MESQGAFHEVNDTIRRLAEVTSADEHWEFFCECDDLECQTRLTLTIEDFDRRRAADRPEPILAVHHAAEEGPEVPDLDQPTT